MPTPDTLVRQYYDCFNERRFADAPSLFTDDAVLEYLPMGEPLRGGNGYIQFAERWMRAFPDGRFAMHQIEQLGDTMCQVELTASGRHLGTLDIGVYQFKPTRAKTTVRMRQFFEFRDGRIAFSSLSFDLQALIRNTRNCRSLTTLLRAG